MLFVQVPPTTVVGLGSGFIRPTQEQVATSSVHLFTDQLYYLYQYTPHPRVLGLQQQQSQPYDID